MALLACSACTEMLEPAFRSGIVIGVSCENTKSTLVPSTGKVNWEDTDQLKLFSDVNRDGMRFVMKENAGSAAEFTNVTEEGATPGDLTGNSFYALFPYSSVLSFDGSAFMLELPSFVDFTPGSFGSEANPMLGKTGNLDKPFVMKNLCGLLRLTLTGTSRLMSLALTLDKPVCGRASIGVDDEYLRVAPDQPCTTTLRCPSGVQLNPSAGTDFYFVVPVNSYGSISVTLTDDRGVASCISKTVDFNIGRSRIAKFAAHEDSDGFAAALEGFQEDNIDDMLLARIPAVIDLTTFNIKNQSDDDDAPSSQDWKPTRRDAVGAYVDSRRPSILCTQECEHRQKEWIVANCSGYQEYGLGSDYGKDSDEEGGSWFSPKYYDKDAGNYIFFRTDKYALMDSGTYWLSSTPGSVSKFSASNHYRCCSWVRLADKESRRQFYVFNTHLHQGYDSGDDDVRSDQLDVLYGYAVSNVNVSGLPMVIVGDMNMTTTGSCLERFKDSGSMQFARNVWNREWDTAHKSYNAWGATGNASNIDHIMYRGFSELRRFWTDNSAYNGVQYMSDHYPVSAELVIQ